MSALFTHAPFAGFGVDPRRQDAPPSGVRVEGLGRGRLRQAVREHCPAVPGVYGMVDARGELIYVGKAKKLRPRLLSYFRAGGPRAKGPRILRRTASIAWEYVPHELAALIRELELIRRWRPRFNVVGQPDARKRVFVCLGRAPAPYFFLATRLTGQVQSAWGPVAAGPRATRAVKTLNDLFLLRDCPRPHVPMRFKDQGHLFDPEMAAGCLRLEIGTCLAPCAAACSRRQYGDQARAAARFLAWASDEPIARLRERMVLAARNLQFEQAALLRDQLESLEWLRAALQRIETARQELTFIYPVTDADGAPWWYLIESGQPRGLIPLRESPPRKLRQLLKQVFQERPCVGGPNDGHVDRELLWLVASWFRRHPGERERTLSVEAALAAA